jgi:hypothetical protein
MPLVISEVEIEVGMFVSREHTSYEILSAWKKIMRRLIRIATEQPLYFRHAG